MRSSPNSGQTEPSDPASPGADHDEPPILRPDESGDARLVELARSGDDDAFADLVRRYERSLVRVLTRLIRDEELARDLAQETFWRVYNRLDRFDTSRRFGPWLFRVGVNLGLDQLRRRDATPSRSIDSTDHTGRRHFDLADPDPRLQVELAQEVQFILERIPISYRTILVLRDLEGFSSAEVAAIVGRREATIRWRLAKARDQFREHWERRQADPRRPEISTDAPVPDPETNDLPVDPGSPASAGR